MRAVNFTFRADVAPARQAALLAEISRWPAIERAKPLRPGATNTGLRRMCYAHVHDGADLDAVVSRLCRQPEIEAAAVPAKRRLG